MTSEEYDKMFQVSQKALADSPQTNKDSQATEEVALKKLNLRTLKGAFLVLLLGFALSLIAFLFERLHWDWRTLGRVAHRGFARSVRGVRTASLFLWRTVLRRVRDMILFKYEWN